MTHQVPLIRCADQLGDFSCDLVESHPGVHASALAPGVVYWGDTLEQDIVDVPGEIANRHRLPWADAAARAAAAPKSTDNLDRERLTGARTSKL